jgi:predicted DsbA family dithiol-disulfide isomerase
MMTPGRLLSPGGIVEQQRNPESFSLQVDIVSDVVCPWCIIGYKQLMKALASFPGQFAVTLQWHPFELNPQMPPEGQDLREHLAQKYGATPDQSRGARARLSALGASLGFTFDYHDGMRMVNTFRAHQLLHWAGEQGWQTELKLALFEAFFSRREDVNEPDLLAVVADRAGLDPVQASEVLADARYAPAVRAEQQYWLEQEVHAVPTFYFQRQYMVPGAQDAEAFVRLLQKIQSRGAG